MCIEKTQMAMYRNENNLKTVEHLIINIKEYIR